MNKVVYFPSLSAGAFASPVNKDLEVAPGIPYKFWDDRTPEEWRHKYFLLTAGHLYKKIDIRKKWGLEDSLVFGDSGGFQIATGAMKWDLSFRDQIFHWLEANSDIACNLDIPPRITFEGRFNESLAISHDNFKYFEKNQSGKTKFLNVIQGANPQEYDKWYHTVKDMQFGGWCFGNSRRLVNFMYILALMLENKEFDKSYNTWIHLLGISKVSDFFILSKFQQLLNTYTDNRITVSTDSSTPGQYPIFGNMIWSVNYKDQVFNMLYFPKDSANINYPTTGHVPSPLNHPGAPYLTWDAIKNYSTEAVTRLTYHNTHIFVHTAKTIDNLVQTCPLEILSEMVPNDLIQVLKSMDEMFESNNPLSVYEKYISYYQKYGGLNTTHIDKAVISDFFDFAPKSNAEHEREQKILSKSSK